MATHEEHCQECLETLGEPFIHVHDWLDEFSYKMGPPHRFERHHTEGVEEVRERWGDQAAEAAILHIKRDYYGQVPVKAQADIWKILGF